VLSAFLKFNKGIMMMSLAAQLWVGLLVAANMIAPLFFLRHAEAQIVLGVFVISGALMMILTALSGFTKLLGLGHILWFPLLGYLWFQLNQLPADSTFGLWVRALIVINAISLVLDTVDVIRFLAGNRVDAVSELLCQQ